MKLGETLHNAAGFSCYVKDDRLFESVDIEGLNCEVGCEIKPVDVIILWPSS